MGDFDGTVAIVTGAAKGIGEATALAFAARGAAVVVADTDEERGESVAAAIRADGGASLFVATDVADAAAVEAMVDRTVAEFGRLDHAFNNAGIEGDPAALAECPRANWDRTIAINLTGVFNCMQSEIPRMSGSGGGSIVNCSSIAGLVGFPDRPAYVASKHGVVGITRGAALELAPGGIRVNAVCPGVIETEMIQRASREQPELMEATVAAHPLGRIGTPAEIAGTVVWLCSDDAGFVTGQAIAVDGGYTTH